MVAAVVVAVATQAAPVQAQAQEVQAAQEPQAAQAPQAQEPQEQGEWVAAPSAEQARPAHHR